MPVIAGIAQQLITPAVTIISPNRRVPNNANRSVRVLFDMLFVDFTNPSTDADLFLEVLRDGAWVKDTSINYIGGPWLNKDGTPQTTAGFQIASVERDAAGNIVRDLRGQDVHVGIRNNGLTAITSGVVIDTK